MAGMTDAHEAECLGHIITGNEFAWASGCFLVLLSADPTDAGTLTNEEGTGARTALAFGASSNGVASNTGGTINIDTTGWSGTDLTHWGISKTSVRGAGQLNWFGQLTGQPISYTPGEILDIPDGNLVVNFFDAALGSPGTKITVVGADKWVDHSLGTTRWTGLATTDVSLHTAAPASSGNEFAGGGYGRDGWTSDTPGSSPPFTTLSHSNPLAYTNIQSSPLRSWGIWQGADLVAIRDQGSDTTVNPGSNIDAPAGRLICAAD